MAFKVFDASGRLLVTGAGGGGGGTGTVTSVAMTVPSVLFTNPPSGSPITTVGSLDVALVTQVQNTVFSGPASGADATPTFRVLVNADLPVVDILHGGTNITTYTLGDTLYASATDVLSKLPIGTAGQVLTVTAGIPSWATLAGTGTVTSFSAGILSPLFTTSVATATTTPALSFILNTQTANTVFAGPTTGAAAAPTFRAIVVADIPALSYWSLNGNTVGNDTTWMGSIDNHDVLFKTNNTTRLTILKTGEIGFNVAPIASTILSIKGAGSTSATYGLKIQDSSSALNFYVRDDGSVSSTNGYWIGADLFVTKGTGGLDNIFVGITAGTSSGASAINNIAIGTNAFHANVTGINSIAIGYRALQASNSAAMDSNSIAIGKDSQILTSSGYQNTSMGTSALSTITTHYNNVAIGFWAGKNVIGVQNTFIGSLADASGSSPNVTNSIAIGNVAIVNDNNQLSIGSTTSPISEVRIGGGFGITSPQVINYYNTDVEAGNLNTISNADIIWNASRGTGTQVGADFVWKVAPGGASGTAQNPLVEAFRIKSTGAIGILNITSIQTGNAGLSTGDIYKDTAANILANGDLILARKV